MSVVSDWLKSDEISPSESVDRQLYEAKRQEEKRIKELKEARARKERSLRDED